jgi:phosphatidate cytidylyltransferase
VNNFLLRTITGFVYVVLLVGSVLLGRITFFLFFQVILVLGLLEFYNLSAVAGAAPQKIYGTAIGSLTFLLSFLFAGDMVDEKVFLLLIPFYNGIFAFELYRQKSAPFTNIAYTFLGILYIAIPFSLLNFFVYPDKNLICYEPQIVLGYFFLLWASDTGAYLAGRAFGKHKFFERISPKKTWEGFLGGFIFTLLIAALISMVFKNIELRDWFVIGSIIVITGAFGDLVESLFKRSLQIKDSGKILPGHGGILDRFDSVILSLPLVFAYLQIIH